MIPLRDTARSRRVPIVNYMLIVLCGLVFLYQWSSGGEGESLIARFGVVPALTYESVFRGHPSVAGIVPLFTSMFLHGGWLHLFGNMIYLYVFGDNVEDRLGHLPYLGFYLLAGLLATLAQVWSSPGATVPMIGASGAIAGVLGAYLFLYPRAKILTLIPLFFFFPMVEVSAVFFLGFWFLMQFVQASLSGAADASGGGVAWWAHAAGFVAGAVLLPVFLLPRRFMTSR